MLQLDNPVCGKLNPSSGGGGAEDYFELASEETTAKIQMYIKAIPQLDTSNITNMVDMFKLCSSLIELPELDTSNVTNMNCMFLSCSNLVSVPQLDASKVINISNVLANCTSLTDFGGFLNLGEAYATGKSANWYEYTLDLSTCTNLTHDSLMNVINNLYDIKTKGCKAQSLKLGSTNLAKLTDEEIAIATNKGWTVT